MIGSSVAISPYLVANFHKTTELTNIQTPMTSVLTIAYNSYSSSSGKRTAYRKKMDATKNKIMQNISRITISATHYNRICFMQVSTRIHTNAMMSMRFITIHTIVGTLLSSAPT